LTRHRIARALRQADTRLNEFTDRAARTDKVINAVPHGPHCKPWRAGHHPHDPTVCVCWKRDYELAKTDPTARAYDFGEVDSKYLTGLRIDDWPRS